MSVDVLCMGNASYDIYFPMDAFPAEDRKYKIETFLEACGGPAANAAYLLGKWGVSCAFAGCVGDDEYGGKIIREFREAGVDTGLAEQRPGFHTPLSCIISNLRSGTRTILNRRIIDNDMRIDPEKLKERAPKIMLFDSHEYEASLRALELFPEAVSVLDGGSFRDRSLDLAEKVTYIICSESFAAAAFGTEIPVQESDLAECARRLSGINPGSGCFTLGGRGLVFWRENGIYRLPAFSVRAVDSTAAGDIFHGAFIYGLTAGRSFADALLYASAAAALSVGKPGGRPSIPSPADVDFFIAGAVRADSLPSPVSIG